LYRIGDRFWKS
jgi:hypothetical protein